jgi:hypothetical protein
MDGVSKNSMGRMESVGALIGMAGGDEPGQVRRHGDHPQTGDDGIFAFTLGMAAAIEQAAWMGRREIFQGLAPPAPTPAHAAASRTLAQWHALAARAKMRAGRHLEWKGWEAAARAFLEALPGWEARAADAVAMLARQKPSMLPAHRRGEMIRPDVQEAIDGAMARHEGLWRRLAEGPKDGG